MANNDVGELFICGGCNAKIGPGNLEKLLKNIPRSFSENLLVGFDTADDAAVIKLNEEQAIIQTLDFFPTMVSDPYLFGKIAAANALSDVYAMGGDVLSAMNIVCFPEEKDLTILGEILRGGAEKVQEAGGMLVGGHSIHDSLPKYGLSVTGTIHPDKILKNNGCQEGDDLILTKPIGVGIITTAYSVGEASEESFEQAVNAMQTLNKYAAEIIRKYPVNSCTDITGFGLIGHLLEMLGESYSAKLHTENIPFVDGAYECAKEFLITAGGQRNRNQFEPQVSFAMDDYAMEELLFDPQTSGGLLVSVPKEYSKQLIEELNTLHLPVGKIGEVITKQEKSVMINELGGNIND